MVSMFDETITSDENAGKLNQNTFCKSQITIGVNTRLTLSDAKLLATTSVPVQLNPESYAAMDKSYQFLRFCIDNRMPIYGMNTHFGDQVKFLDPYLTDASIAYAEYNASINRRQENLIKSHAC